MATLSTKVSQRLADRFDALAGELGVSTSRLLRDLAEMRVKYRLLHIGDDEVELGFVFLDDPCTGGRCALVDDEERL